VRSGWQDHGAKSHSLVAVRARPAIDTEASLQQLTPGSPAGSLGRGGTAREDIGRAALELGRSGRDSSQNHLGSPARARGQHSIPVSQSRGFDGKLKEAAVEHVYTEIDGMDHGWHGEFSTPVVAEVRDQVLEWLKE